MKENVNPFKFKVIETVYNGYRFRSRLEARWAVFFDTLGIKYEYEKEGYDLEGTWYLPDFWLPNLDRFVEIKGQEPTEEELHKAELLAHYTGKVTYILAGNIPSLQEDMNIVSAFYPAYLRATQEKRDAEGHLIDLLTKEIEVSKGALAILQKLHDGYINVNPYDRQLFFEPACVLGSEDLGLLLSRLDLQRTCLTEIMPYIGEYEEEIADALTPDDGWQIEFVEQVFVSDVGLVECQNCEEITTGVARFKHHMCDGGVLSNDTPRLIAAYTAARQARF